VQTLEELKEYLITQVSEVDLVDLLGLTTEDIVEMYHDKIEGMYESLIESLELDLE
jgi:hypothetical protein